MSEWTSSQVLLARSSCRGGFSTADSADSRMSMTVNETKTCLCIQSTTTGSGCNVCTQNHRYCVSPQNPIRLNTTYTCFSDRNKLCSSHYNLNPSLNSGKERKQNPKNNYCAIWCATAKTNVLCHTFRIVSTLLLSFPFSMYKHQWLNRLHSVTNEP